jgi:hypothetical protein
LLKTVVFGADKILCMTFDAAALDTNLSKLFVGQISKGGFHSTNLKSGVKI